jgi:hypothetical protein
MDYNIISLHVGKANKCEYLNILGTIDFNIEVNTNLSIVLLYEYETYCQIEEDLC